MKISLYSKNYAKILQISAWILTGVNSLYASIVVFFMGLWIPRLWLLALPWILVFISALFWELFSSIVLTLGGLGGIIWYFIALNEGIILLIAFGISTFVGILMLVAWILERRKKEI